MKRACRREKCELKHDTTVAQKALLQAVVCSVRQLAISCMHVPPMQSRLSSTSHLDKLTISSLLILLFLRCSRVM